MNKMMFVAVLSLLCASFSWAQTPVASLVEASSTPPMVARCAGPEGRMTSATYLVSVATCLHGASDPVRVALVQDINIKSWSYAYLNKGTFWIAILLAVLVLIWPSIVAIASVGPRKQQPKPGEAQEPETPVNETDPTKPGRLRYLRNTNVASALQTSIAALAALCFAFYAHYKGNQVTAENLIREIIFAEKITPKRMTTIIAAVAEMDKGFSFASIEGVAAKSDQGGN
ncbi:MAG: hypothetical protein ABJL67_23120 [Sulfitobacter sp.]